MAWNRREMLGKLARVLVEHSVRVRPGDLVTIVGEPCLMEAAEAIYEAVLRAGGHPSFHVRSDRLRSTVLRHGNDEQVRHVSPFEEHRFAKCDVLMVLMQKQDDRSTEGIDPRRAAMMDAARRGVLGMSLERLAKGETRYVLTEIPGAASARDVGMSLEEYEEWVWRAGFLHLADPVAGWLELREQQQRLIEFLSGRRVLRLVAPASDGADGDDRHDGTDLTVDVTGMTWLNRCGDENFPDGEVDSGPRGMDGVANVTFPAVHRGVVVEGARLEFRGGRIVNASARTNEAFLIAMLDQDEGARGAGEIGIGTNYHITRGMRNTFFDEKIGGTFHVAAGAGYPSTGNTNKSGLHWDFVMDLRRGGAMYADGEMIQQNGRFLREGWPGR